jgi:hypothetical protein
MPRDSYGGRELQNRYAKIVARAWRDEDFKRRLIGDPGAVFKEEGVPVSPGRDVKVLEQTSRVFYFVLPSRPANLSDEQLDQEAIALGSCVVTECDICATK